MLAFIWLRGWVSEKVVQWFWTVLLNVLQQKTYRLKTNCNITQFIIVSKMKQIIANRWFSFSNCSKVSLASSPKLLTFVISHYDIISDDILSNIWIYEIECHNKTIFLTKTYAVVALDDIWTSNILESKFRKLYINVLTVNCLLTAINLGGWGGYKYTYFNVYFALL